MRDPLFLDYVLFLFNIIHMFHTIIDHVLFTTLNKHFIFTHMQEIFYYFVALCYVWLLTLINKCLFMSYVHVHECHLLPSNRVAPQGYVYMWCSRVYHMLTPTIHYVLEVLTLEHCLPKQASYLSLPLLI